MPGWKISNMCVLRVCAEAGEEGEASNFSRDLVRDLASNYLPLGSPSFYRRRRLTTTPLAALEMLAFIGSQGYAPAAGLKTVSSRAAAPAMYSSKSDLEALAKELNPVIGFWDPLKLADQEFWGESNEATIGFLRHAEIKHGRVAMAGFVGYCVHATGFHFPWKMSGFPILNPPGQLSVAGDHLTPNAAWFPEYNGGAWPTLENGDVASLWDQLSGPAKYQILFAIFFLELWGESSASGTTHYMRPGGKPGYYPPLKGDSLLPHPAPLDLWDPFGFTKKMSAEKKAKSLVAEINNGRLAMLGLMAFLSESKIPGSVPALTKIGIGATSSAAVAMQPFGCAVSEFGCSP